MQHKVSTTKKVFAGIAGAFALFLLIGAFSQPSDQKLQSSKTPTDISVDEKAAAELNAAAADAENADAAEPDTTASTTEEDSVAADTTGTSNCDSNYSGACVPIASDVDCAGGSGNGPAYVQGPVYVTGTDIYGLDRNGDGIGCE